MLLFLVAATQPAKLPSIFSAWLFPFIFACIIAVVAFRVLTKNKKADKAKRDDVGDNDPDELVVKKTVASLLTPTEMNFYTQLHSAVPESTIIMVKVRLADLVEYTRSDFPRFAQKHADFVLCERLTMRPVLVVELDDSSHNRLSAKEKDNNKNNLLKAYGMEILRVTASRSYNRDLLRDAVNARVNKSK